MELVQQPLYVFSNLLLYLFMLFLAYRGIMNRDGEKFRYILSVFLMFLFCEYAFWGGDYFYYISEFKEARLGARVNLEPFYYMIARIFTSYESIRLIIWGMALVLLLLAFRIIEKKSEYLTYVYISTYFIWFTYARASLAMAAIILGTTLLAHSNRKLLFLQMLGLGLLVLSINFHKSATFGIVMGIFAIASYRLGKWAFLFLIFIGFVVMYRFIDVIDLMDIAELQEERLEYTMGVAQNYLEGEERSMGYGELVEKVSFHISVYMIAILFLMSVFDEKNKEFPKYARIFGCYAYWAALSSSVFLLDLNYNTSELYERFSMYALIPGSIFLWKLYDTGYKRKYTITTLVIAVFSTLYTLSYTYYCSVLN